MDVGPAALAMTCPRRQLQPTHLQVHKVTCSSCDTATIEVHMSESAEVHVKGEVQRSWKCKRQLQYHLARTDAGWRIVGSLDITPGTAR